jgi:hypothetical protein
MTLVRTSPKTWEGISELFAQLAAHISAKVRKRQFISLGRRRCYLSRPASMPLFRFLGSAEFAAPSTDRQTPVKS